jgi:hypothetical protein
MHSGQIQPRPTGRLPSMVSGRSQSTVSTISS